MGIELLNELGQALRESLANQSLTTCSRWAAKRRIMGEPFPGPYSWKYHPWVQEMHDSEAPFNCAMKSAQMGVTEVCINRALYTIAHKRRDVLYVLPTQLNATDFSKARFNTALRLSPILSDIFTDTNTVSLKQAGNNTLYIRGSRGDSNLKSIPVSELILDELDEMDQKQIWLALQRLSGQLQKSVWAISTPTIPGYGIHELYLKSSQEHYYFKCPGCGRATELTWPECFELVGESVTDQRRHQSYVKCKECNKRLEHESKPEWLASAKWKPTFADRDDHRGFHVNQLYSFTVKPGEIAENYFRGQHDELANKEFHNSVLGLPFIGQGAQLTDQDIVGCFASHSLDDPRPIKGGRRLITMGVDQGKWSYYVIREWFVESFSNDLNVSAVAKELHAGKFVEDEWDRILDLLMYEWQVVACVIDADPQINEARRFARRFPGSVWLCRYRRGQTAKEISVTDDGDDAPIATVDRASWLSASLGRYRSKRIQLPRNIPHEYLEHQKNLVRTYERDDLGNPRAVYQDVGPDHFAHAACYAEIALPFAASFQTNTDIGKFL